MAMTKAEKAYVEELETLLALKRTAPVDPDIDPRNLSGKAYGFSESSVTVTWRYPEKAVTTSSSHGRFPDGSTRSMVPDSQRGIALHSTRLGALQYTRNKLERRAAEVLREIDLAIAEETANPTKIGV